MAVICVKAGGTLDSAASVAESTCKLNKNEADPEAKADQLWGLVTNSEAASIAVLNLLTGESKDFDEFSPGYTRMKLAGQPHSIVTSAEGKFAYFSQINSAASQLPGAAAIGRLAVSQLSAYPVYQEIPYVGTALQYLAGDAADGSQDTLAVAIPEHQGVLFVPVEGFGEHDPLTLTFVQTAGRASSLALRKAGDKLTTLFVAHDDVPVLTAVLLPSNETVNISLLPDCSFAPPDVECLSNRTGSDESPQVTVCSNGIDDDLDGFVDFPDDPQCESLMDDSEMGILPACNDGQDNDGDGLVDFPDDPDCASPEAPLELSQCDDGVNNDFPNGLGGAESNEDLLGRDTLVDNADPQCTEGALLETTVIPYWVSWALGIGLPGCANGTDDDKDGLPDLADPDCNFSVRGSEFPLGTAPMSDVAVSTDGKYAYVTHRGGRQVIVIDAATLEITPLNDREENFGHKLWHLEGKLGISLPTPPVSIAFSSNKLTYNYQYWFRKLFPDHMQADNKSDVNADSAYIATSAGDVFMVDADVGGKSLHLLRQSTYNGLTEPASTISAPELFDNGKKVTQSFAARADYANMGPFTVDSSTLSYYGVKITASSRTLRNEQWTITHRGTLPQSNRTTGRVVSQQTDEDGMRVAIFHDPYADFCQLGVEPGDTLVIRPGYRLACGAEDTPVGIFKGDRFDFRIRRRTADTLVLEPDGAVGIVELTDDERNQLKLNPNDVGELTYLSSLAHPNCFVTAGSYDVEVPHGSYLVVGSQTGYLHPWRNNGGICEKFTDDPLHVGRAREAIPTTDQTPTECTLPLPNDAFTTEYEFSNYLFSFNIRPGCAFDSVTGTTHFVTTARHLQLRFQTRSGFTAARGVAGTTLTGVRRSAPNNIIYVIDSGGSTITPFNPNTLGAFDPLF